MQQLIGQAVGRRSREQWQQLVDQCEQSGLTQKAFCEQNGIKYDRLAFWKRKLRKRAEGSEFFIEMPREITGDLPSKTAWEVELDLGNGTILRLRR
jgi:transposase-like protein